MLRGGSRYLTLPQGGACGPVFDNIDLDKLLEDLNLGHECYVAGWGQHTEGTVSIQKTKSL